MIVDIKLLVIELALALIVGVLAAISMTRDIKYYPNTKKEKSSMYISTVGSIIIWVAVAVYTILEHYEVI